MYCSELLEQTVLGSSTKHESFNIILPTANLISLRVGRTIG